MCHPLSIVLWTMQRDLGRTGCQMQRGAVATGVELFLLWCSGSVVPKPSSCTSACRAGGALAPPWACLRAGMEASFAAVWSQSPCPWFLVEAPVPSLCDMAAWLPQDVLPKPWPWLFTEHSQNWPASMEQVSVLKWSCSVGDQLPLWEAILQGAHHSLSLYLQVLNIFVQVHTCKTFAKSGFKSGLWGSAAHKFSPYVGFTSFIYSFRGQWLKI